MNKDNTTIVFFTKEDVQYISSISNIIHGFAYVDGEWESTSILFPDGSTHFHGNGKTLIECLEDMRNQVIDYKEKEEHKYEDALNKYEEIKRIYINNEI